jgi:hypothetical protein
MLQRIRSREKVSTLRRMISVSAAAVLLVGPVGVAQASPPTPASGTITQTSAIPQDIRFAGPTVILESAIEADIDGTLSGEDWVETLRVVIHPNGRFTAHGTATCACTVDGKSGEVELVVSDTGQNVDGTPTFQGRYVITRATGELAGLQGVLDMEGTLDLTTGLATITYSGQIHLHP